MPAPIIDMDTGYLCERLPPPRSGANASPGAVRIRCAEIGHRSIDVATLKKVVGHDPTFLREFLDDFQVLTGRGMRELCQAMRQRDVAGIKRCAHRMKSGAKAVGAHRFGAALARLEDFPDGNWVIVRAAAAELCGAWREVERDISKVIHSLEL